MNTNVEAQAEAWLRDTLRQCADALPPLMRRWHAEIGEKTGVWLDYISFEPILQGLPDEALAADRVESDLFRVVERIRGLSDICSRARRFYFLHRLGLPDTSEAWAWIFAETGDVQVRLTAAANVLVNLKTGSKVLESVLAAQSARAALGHKAGGDS